MENLLVNPTATRDRRQEPDNVYHLYNRVAHSVKFLNEEEKDDFLERVRRVAEFCGIKLLAWCVMTNHFHLLVYLPKPQDLSDEELKRRIALLKPEEYMAFREGFVLERAPRLLKERMFNIGVMMKLVKGSFTQAYNERTGHKGTMWEGPYHFKRIPKMVKDLSTVASYQNLNPVRACLAADYTSYRWTSFAAAEKGDRVALEGLEFIFRAVLPEEGDRTNSSELIVQPETLIAMMREKMDHDLEACQRARAEAVWRKRFAGQLEERPDPLTNEAMVAQVEAQMARMQTAEFQEELARALGRKAKEDEVRIVRAMAAAPEAKTAELARVVGASESRVKHVSVLLQKLGIIRREGTKRQSSWRINLFGKRAA